MMRGIIQFLLRLVIFAAGISTFLVAVPYALVLRLAFPVRNPGKRIFIGIAEVANIIDSISGCLSRHGYECDAFIISNRFSSAQKMVGPDAGPNVRYIVFNTPAGRALSCLRLMIDFLVLLPRKDIFLMVWDVSFLPLSLDSLIIRLAGRRLLFMNCGDDVRYRPLQRNIDALSGLDLWPEETHSFCNFFRKIYRQTLCELCGDVMSMMDQATFQKKPLFFFRFPQARLVSGPRAASENPLIIHCPSDPRIKRTDIVVKAIDMLRAEGLAFRFELVQGLPNEAVLMKIREADIVVDQPWIWVARLGVEAAASGCCVVGGNRPEISGRNDSPVLQFEPDAQKLAATLRELLRDRGYRELKMRECYEFWQRAYSFEAYAAFFEEFLGGTADRFMPIPSQKDVLLRHAQGKLMKALIRLSYAVRGMR